MGSNILGIVREVGKFQWTCILLNGITSASFIMVNLLILLIAPRIDFECSDTSAAFNNVSIEHQRILMSGQDQCLRPNIDFANMSSDELLAVNVSMLDKRKCDYFKYDKTVFQYTVTERFNLVCDRAWLIPLAKTIYMGGYLIGAVMCGSLADRFGRKIVLVISGFLSIFWHLMCGFSPYVELFLLSRLLLAVSCISFFTVGQILQIELVRSDQRKMPRAALSCSSSIVGITINGIALLVLDYRYLQLLQAVITLVSTVLIWFHFPESPRWLCAQQRKDEALKIIERIAKFNGKCPDEYNYLLQSSKSDDNTRTTLLDLYRTPLLRKRSLIMATLWFCHIFLIYALIYNLDRFWPDVRVSMMISGAIELPNMCVPFLTIDRLGRQFMTMFFLVSSGICCFCMTPFVTQRGSPWLLLFALMAKLLASSQFFIGSVFIQEIYPTNLRGQGMGMASTIGRVGGMLAPQLTYNFLNKVWPEFSVVLMGFVAIFGGLLAPALPDTTGSELPVTVQDGEEFFKDHKYRIKVAFLNKRKKNRVEESDLSRLDDGGDKQPLKIDIPGEISSQADKDERL